ncbi:MAG: phage major capsid protein [Bacteroidota bacterium]
MSATKSQLYEQRNNLFKQMEDLIKTRSTADGLSAEDQATYDKMLADEKKLRQQIENLKALDEIRGFSDGVEERVAEQPKDKPTYERAFVNWIKGAERMSAEERAILDSGYTQFRGTATQVVGTPGLGGYLVPEEWANDIYKFMSVWGGVLQVCDIIDTASGGTMNFPATNDSVEAAVVTEANASVVSDTTLTNITLSSFMYTTKIMKASIQLLRDSKYDVARFIRETLGERMGKGTNKDFTTGAGTTVPYGVVTQSTQGATHSAISRAKLVGLKYSVAEPYRMNGTWMMNSTSMGQIVALTLGSGDDRPLYIPSPRDGEPDRIEGRPVVINEHMDSVDSGGADKYPVLYGDFKQFKVRRIGGFEIFPFNELYMASLEKAWLGYAAFDSKLFNTAAVKHLLTT